MISDITDFIRQRPVSDRTPFHKMQNASDLGVEVWCKREDLIDGIGSGHKARKLSYLIKEALQSRATVLMTAASTPSGQAVAIAAAASAANLRSHIVYCGDHHEKPTTPQGNYLLTSLLGASVTWREKAPFPNWRTYVDEVAAEESAVGEVPYILEPGLSHGTGLFGSIELGMEIAAELPSDSETHIVAVAGSGGTSLGLAIAASAIQLPWKVHGVCMATGGSREKSLEQDINLRNHARMFLPSDIVDNAEVDFWDGAMGTGYDLPSEAEFNVMRTGLQRHNLILDTTYMAKAYIGMTQMIDADVIPRGSRVVLIHSGGNFDLFRSTPAQTAWMRENLASYLKHT